MDLPFRPYAYRLSLKVNAAVMILFISPRDWGVSPQRTEEAAFLVHMLPT